MALIKIRGIPSTEFFHKRSRSSFCNFFNENMEMVRHEHPCTYRNEDFSTINVLQLFTISIAINKVFSTVC